MNWQLLLPLAHADARIGMLALLRLGTGFPSGLGRILFENHWAIWGAMLLLGGAGLWQGINMRRTVMRNVGVGILAALVLWITAAWMVVTPYERLVNANTAVISAAARDDVPAIMRYVSKRAICGQWNYAQIQSGLAVRLKMAHITHNIIRTMAVRIIKNQAITHLVIWTSTRDYGPVVTVWRLVWQDHHRPGNWRIMEVDLLRINGHRERSGAAIPMTTDQ
ncbi:MAG: hypothetical protein ACP5I8_01555 [Phycisphaerae bacterium]